MKKILISLILFFLVINISYSQAVKSVVPDSGYQNSNFPVTINGIATEWMTSNYFEVYFDSTGVTTNNVQKVNDTTLTAQVYITNKAPAIYRKIFVLDQFNNIYEKENALRVLLTIPVTPTLLLPPNNSTNQLQNLTLLWDSNASASSFRIQLCNDSLFVSIFFDTTVANTPYQFRPNFLQLGAKYYWRVNASNIKGTSPWSVIWNFRIRTTSVEEYSNEIPREFILHNNYPNPFNPVTNIRFQIPKSSFVTMKIYDINGRLCEILINQKLQAGSFQTQWNAIKYSSGIYFISIQADEFSAVKKIALVK